MSAGWYLQKAIAAKLAAFGSTSGYTVSDNIDTNPPFVFIGPSQVSREIRHSSGELYIDEVEVHIWTHNLSGSKTAKEMMEDVKDALFDATLDLTADSWNALCRPEKTFETILAELDDAGREMRHAVARFRFHTSK